ncbi:MAG: hypothetical protein MHM6MM_008845, partial [Cercozoa sp. M6MM]
MARESEWYVSDGQLRFFAALTKSCTSESHLSRRADRFTVTARVSYACSRRWSMTEWQPSVGTVCEAIWSDGHFYRARIEDVLPNGLLQVLYVDYGESYQLGPSQVRAPPDWSPSVQQSQVDSSQSSSSSSGDSSTVVQQEQQLPPQATPLAPTSPSEAGSRKKDDEELSEDELTEDWDDAKMEKTSQRRLLVARELVATERTFVSGLRMCAELFIQPLRQQIQLSALPENKQSPMLSMEEHTTLFSDIESLQQLNTQLLGDMEQRLQQWEQAATLPNHQGTDQQVVSDLFLEFAPYFRMYSRYASNHNHAAQLARNIRSQRKYRALREWLDERSAMPECKGASLESLLITPIQRIPRYRLLVEE